MDPAPRSPRFLGTRHALFEAGDAVELRDRLDPGAPATRFSADDAGWAAAIAELRRRDGRVWDVSAGAPLEPGSGRPGGRRWIVAALVGTTALLAAVTVSLVRDDPGAGPIRPADAPVLSEAEVVERARRSTMLVVVYEQDVPVAVGSGWVYDASARLVVTNAHVVEGGASLRVGQPGTLAAASVVATAPCEDLAVLQPTALPGFEALPLAPDESAQVGDGVAALGFPPDLPVGPEATRLRWSFGAITHGHVDVVSGLTDLIEHSARLDFGNSGGPLVDLRGRLVGVNVGIGVEDPTVGYAIPARRVRSVVPAMLAGLDVCAA